MLAQLSLNIIHQPIDDVVVDYVEFSLLSRPRYMRIDFSVEIDNVTLGSCRVLDVEFRELSDART
jgi:hypothetical protein